MFNNQKIFDTIVIGSGAGGLSSASYLSRKGLNVLLCEKRREVGGYLNSFTRTGKSGDKYTFDTGVHYLGECMEGSGLSKVFKEAIGEPYEKMKWNLMDPAGINRYVYKDFEYSYPMGLKNFEMMLLSKFPDAQGSITNAFKLIKDTSQVLKDLSDIEGKLASQSLAGKMSTLFKLIPKIPLLRRMITKTAKEFCEGVTDLRVLKILDNFSTEVGVTLSEASPMLLVLFAVYSHGGFYPQGGTKPLIKMFCDTILKSGGTILKNAGVTGIKKEGNVFRVHTPKGEFFTKTIVSNTDAKVLYSDLLPQELVGKKIKKKIQNTVPSVSNLYTFVGTDLDLSKYMNSGNLLLIDENFFSTEMKASSLQNTYFLTSPTLKDPNGGHSAKGKYSLEILCSAGDFEDWKQWENSKPYQRPIEYMKKKEEIGMHAIKVVERNLIPNLSKHLDFIEFATPLTNLHYTSAPNGSMYGPALTPSQSFLNWFPIKTKIPGLYHCGSSTLCGGVAACCQTGIQAAKKLLKFYKK
ncbi:hypothetical protein M0812_24089 [Anaeramoeba flamelloides]|uniref:Amine oxidase domain-containing protein n=1 Tax=Anaeramoeba flamelloides TaxID=1746091 RepID=A0AAV7YJH9_9EUKA|nr:hypothetical protein M0812_24089 [Anaeramoeba flamelloides]